MSKKIIGIMSGTSLDGVDAALVNISERNNNIDVDLIDFISMPYAEDFRREILKCTDEAESNVKDICRLNVKLAEKFSDTVFELMKKADFQTSELDLIGSHGQTIYHDVGSKDFISTLQIGSGSFLAERTGITTVHNFRMRDLAAGGEGAPLVPYVDHLLYTDKEKNRILQNIGGIGNYTYLPADGDLNEVMGSDTGPGNMMIDTAVNIFSDGKYSYDRDGKMAEKGDSSDTLIDFMASHSFIKRDAPKSTGRKDYGKDYVEKIISLGKENNLSDEDIIASITEFTAFSIIDAYKRFLPDNIDEIIIGGGGSYNPVLMRKIKKYSEKKLSESVSILTQEELGYSSEAKEAVAFAVLAYQTMNGRTNNVPEATGAEKSVVLGEIVPGHNFNKYFKW